MRLAISLFFMSHSKPWLLISKLCPFATFVYESKTAESLFIFQPTSSHRDSCRKSKVQLISPGRFLTHHQRKRTTSRRKSQDDVSETATNRCNYTRDSNGEQRRGGDEDGGDEKHERKELQLYCEIASCQKIPKEPTAWERPNVKWSKPTSKGVRSKKLISHGTHKFWLRCLQVVHCRGPLFATHETPTWVFAPILDDETSSRDCVSKH